MTVHKLKSWPEFYHPIETGAHRFTLRRNDRKFKVGDVVVFQEWKPDDEGGGTYTGSECKCRITAC